MCFEPKYQTSEVRSKVADVLEAGGVDVSSLPNTIDGGFTEAIGNLAN